MLNRRNGYEYEDLLACARGEMFGPVQNAGTEDFRVHSHPPGIRRVPVLDDPVVQAPAWLKVRRKPAPDPRSQPLVP